MPNITNLEITTRIGCANMCAYCPQDLLVRAYQRRGGDMVMRMGTFAVCLHDVPRNVQVGFTGMCEPFLNPSAVLMIEHAVAKGHGVYVSTTLFSLFAVHLPAEKGDRIPADDAYGTMLHAVAKSRIKNLAFHFHGDRVHPAARRVLGERAVKQARLISRAGNVPGAKMAAHAGPVTCRRKFGHPVLLPNGDLLLCCMDYGLRHVLGSLLHTSLEGIYQGQAFRQALAASGRDGGSLCHACDAYGVQK